MLEMDLALVDLLRGAWPDQWRARDSELLWTRLAASADFRHAVEQEFDLRSEAAAVLNNLGRDWPGPARTVAEPPRKRKALVAVIAAGFLFLIGVIWFGANPGEEKLADSSNIDSRVADNRTKNNVDAEPKELAESTVADEKSTAKTLPSTDPSETDVAKPLEAAVPETEQTRATDSESASEATPQHPVAADPSELNEQPAEEPPLAQAEPEVPAADPDPALANLTGREKRLLRKKQLEAERLDPRRDHPLELVPTREAQSLWLELTGSLAEQHWTDFQRTLESVSPALLGSLVADFKDESLWISYATMMETLLEDQPRYRTLIQQEMEPLSKLRLAAALEKNNADQMADVAWHFYGTDAAAQAHLWLADRAISTGDFATARTYYERAKPYAAISTQEQLEVRLRLAGAMLGTPFGEPVTESVQVASEKFSAVNFEAMVLTQQLTHQRRYVSPELVGAERQTVYVAAPLTKKGKQQEFLTTTWVQYKDQASSRRGDKQPDERSLPADELFSLPVGELTLLGNVYAVSAVETRSGKRRWKKDLTSEHERHGLKAIGPVMPSVADGHVYVRRWTREGTELLCLNLTAGDVLWTTELTPNENKRDLRGIMLTDAQVSGQQLSLFTATPTEHTFTRRKFESKDIVWEIRLSDFARRNGTLLKERTLVKLTGLINTPRCSRVANIGRWRVIQIAGTVIAVEASGELAWVRKVPWQEPDQYNPAYRCAAVGEKDVVCVWQAGGTTVECLEVSTGHRLWQVPASPITQLVGCQQGRLLAITKTGLQGYDLSDGRAVWSKDIPYTARHAVLCGSPGGLVYADSEQTPDGGWQAKLFWVDALTGETTNTAALQGELPIDNPQVKPLISPLISHGTGMLAGFDSGSKRQLSRQLLWIAPAE